MNDHRQSTESTSDVYEPPAVAERTRVDFPLVATIGSSGPSESAAFHAEDEPEAYEPPVIAERTRVDMPLIGTTSGPPVCAAFHN